MAPGQQPVFPHDPGKEPGHGGFGRAGIAGEHHVHDRAIDFHALVRKKLLRLMVVQRLQNDLLSLGQADHFHQLLVGVALRFGFLHLGFTVVISLYWGYTVVFSLLLYQPSKIVLSSGARYPRFPSSLANSFLSVRT